jgi:amino acid transporter
MSEQIKDAGHNVPRAMFWGYIVNGIMALVLLIANNFATPSVEDSLNDVTGFPFLYVFKQFTSTSGVNALTSIILLPMIFSNILFNAATSRQTFAFARDKGLPFHQWISKYDKERNIPVNAIALSCIITCLLSLINIGSSTAFNAIISLNTAALMFTYTISISCVIYRKIWLPDTLPRRHWDLGRWGLVVNIVGVCYCAFALFWSFWPTEMPVLADNFNWSIVIFGAIFILSLVMYAVKGMNEYEPPVESVDTNVS